MLKTVLTFVLSAFTLVSMAQQTINIGGWRMHLPYNSIEQIIESPNLLFVRAEIGLYSFNKLSGEIEKYTTVEGFAESEVSAIAYSEQYNTLVIGYRNTNIDLLKDGKIINLPGIKRKSIVGAKDINEISIYGKYAYVSTSFGVVVIDVDVEDIADSYLNIGPAGSNVPILSAAEYDDKLYLGTEDGLMMAPLQGKNLSDFNSWSFVLPDTVDNTLLRVYNDQMHFVRGKDRWIFTGSAYIQVDVDNPFAYNDIQTDHDKLLVCRDDNIYLYDATGLIRTIDQKLRYTAVLDHQNNVWTGGFYSGLIKIDPNNQQSFLRPQGPFGPSSFRMASMGEEVWVTSGGHSANYSPLFTNSGYYVFEKGEWTNRDLSNPRIASMFDFTTVEVNPATGDVWLGSFGTGLLHLKNGEFVERYDKTNSPLDEYVNNWVMILGLALEENGDLWISNFEAQRTLAVRHDDGTWETFDVGNQRLGEILIDEFGTKWILVERGSSPTAERGIIAFKREEDGTVRIRRLVKGEGAGNLPHSSVNAAVMDKDGEIWIGTDAGLAVFYNPSLVFQGGVNADAQQIIIDDGQDVGYLLGNEVVNDIKVDGANRKWAATNNGVWLISADGSEVIHHFTTLNSPMPSDEVHCIAINGVSGEVFFGTEAGIISYRSDATEASDLHVNTLVYPNPVHKGYEGPITITGLPEDATVKIADIAGRVVYEMIATGGTAVWDGRNFAGELPASGVYLIFTANKEDEDVLVTKLLIVR